MKWVSRASGMMCKDKTSKQPQLRISWILESSWFPARRSGKLLSICHSLGTALSFTALEATRDHFLRPAPQHCRTEPRVYTWAFREKARLDFEVLQKWPQKMWTPSILPRDMCLFYPQPSIVLDLFPTPRPLIHHSWAWIIYKQCHPAAQTISSVFMW